MYVCVLLKAILRLCWGFVLFFVCAVLTFLQARLSLWRVFFILLQGKLRLSLVGLCIVAKQIETFMRGFVSCCKANWDFHEWVCVLLQGKLRLSWVGFCIIVSHVKTLMSGFYASLQTETLMTGFLHRCKPSWVFDKWVCVLLQAKLTLWFCLRTYFKIPHLLQGKLFYKFLCELAAGSAFGACVCMLVCVCVCACMCVCVCTCTHACYKPGWVSHMFVCWSTSQIKSFRSFFWHFWQASSFISVLHYRQIFDVRVYICAVASSWADALISFVVHLLQARCTFAVS